MTRGHVAQRQARVSVEMGVFHGESAQHFPGGASRRQQRSPRPAGAAADALWAADDAELPTFQREPVRVQVPLTGITSGTWMMAEVRCPPPPPLSHSALSLLPSLPARVQVRGHASPPLSLALTRGAQGNDDQVSYTTFSEFSAAARRDEVSLMSVQGSYIVRVVSVASGI